MTRSVPAALAATPAAARTAFAERTATVMPATTPSDTVFGDKRRRRHGRNGGSAANGVAGAR